jgi:hypothetical protein
MNRFIYYYRVFDIVVNQTTGELYWRPLHCLAYLKMGIVEGENEENKGNESSYYATSRGACRLPDKFPLQRYGRGVQILTTKASGL